MRLFVSPSYDGSIVRNERNWKEDWIRLYEKSLIIYCRVSKFKLRLLIFNGRYIDHLSRWICSTNELSRSIYQFSRKRGEKKGKEMERKRGEKFKHELWQTVCIDSGVNVGSESFPFELTRRFLASEWCSKVSDKESARPLPGSCVVLIRLKSKQVRFNTFLFEITRRKLYSEIEYSQILCFSLDKILKNSYSFQCLSTFKGKLYKRFNNFYIFLSKMHT